MTRREFILSSSALAVCGCRMSGATDALCAVDPERDFAGVVLGGQVAGKKRTMDERVRLLRLMA